MLIVKCFTLGGKNVENKNAATKIPRKQARKSYKGLLVGEARKLTRKQRNIEGITGQRNKLVGNQTYKQIPSMHGIRKFGNRHKRTRKHARKN